MNQSLYSSSRPYVPIYLTTDISSKIGCSAKTLGEWMRRQDIEEGNREGLTQSERAEMKELKREIKELRQANEILRRA